MNNDLLITLDALRGNEPTSLHPLQAALLPHVGLLEMAWWTVFVVTLGIVVFRYVRETLQHYRKTTE